jgi:hypothetical protein
MGRGGRDGADGGSQNAPGSQSCPAFSQGPPIPSSWNSIVQTVDHNYLLGSLNEYLPIQVSTRKPPNFSLQIMERPKMSFPSHPIASQHLKITHHSPMTFLNLTATAFPRLYAKYALQRTTHSSMISLCQPGIPTPSPIQRTPSVAKISIHTVNPMLVNNS